MTVTLNPTWTLGDRISKARRACGMEQADVALALDVSRAQVSKWERDVTEPSASQAAKYAALTGVTLEWLLGVTVGELLCELHAEPGCPLCSPAELAMTYSPAMSRAS